MNGGIGFYQHVADEFGSLLCKELFFGDHREPAIAYLKGDRRCDFWIEDFQCDLTKELFGRIECETS